MTNATWAVTPALNRTMAIAAYVQHQLKDLPVVVIEGDRPQGDSGVEVGWVGCGHRPHPHFVDVAGTDCELAGEAVVDALLFGIGAFGEPIGISNCVGVLALEEPAPYDDPSLVMRRDAEFVGVWEKAILFVWPGAPAENHDVFACSLYVPHDVFSIYEGSDHPEPKADEHTPAAEVEDVEPVLAEESDSGGIAMAFVNKTLSCWHNGFVRLGLWR